MMLSWLFAVNVRSGFADAGRLSLDRRIVPRKLALDRDEVESDQRQISSGASGEPSSDSFLAELSAKLKRMS